MQLNNDSIHQTINKIQEIKRYFKAESISSSSTDDPTKIVGLILKDLVIVLSQEPKLFKIFAKWSGNKNLTPEYIDINHIAKRILQREEALNLDTLEAAFHRRREVLTQGSRLIGPHLHGVSPELLEANWQKSYSILLEIKRLNGCLEDLKIGKGEAERKNIDSIQAKIKVWAFHFLARGAKIPILDPEKIQHLPFIEYLSDNKPSYYRGDGGIAMELFLKNLPKELTDYCLCVPIKNQHYERIIEFCCRGIDCKRILFSEGMVVTNERDFIDVTEELKDSINYQETLLECWKKIGKESDQLVLGGVVTINRQEVFICYPMNGQLAGWLFGEFQNIQGVHGLFPELISLKHRLFDQGFSLQDLQECYPFNQPQLERASKEAMQIDELQEGLSTVISCLDATCKEAEKENWQLLTRIYLNLVKKLLNPLIIPDSAEQKVILSITLPVGFGKMTNSLIKLQKIERGDAHPYWKFHQSLQEIYLLIETVLYMMIFLTDGREEYLVHQILNSLSNFPLPDGVAKNSYSLTSGMSTLGCIADALIEEIYKQNKPRAVFIQGSYYEIFESGGVKDYLKDRYVSPMSDEEESLLSSIEDAYQHVSNSDVLFTDLHPNFVTLSEVQTVPVVQLTLEALKNRERMIPFTLVLDTSTTLFFHEEISLIIQNEQISQALQEGRLIIVTTCSLAKFSMAGLDKYTGGAIQVYGNEGCCDDLFTKFQRYSNNDPFSGEASKFLYLLYSNCKEDLVAYFHQIRGNTRYLYSKLEPLIVENNPIKVGMRDDGIVMLGIHFDKIANEIEPEDAEQLKQCLTLLVQYYFYAQCARQNLPLSIRSSFGFPSSTIIECHTALRMTVGLESEEMLDAYAKTLVAINEELKEALKNDSLKSTLTLLGSQENFHDLLLQKHILIIEKDKTLNFVQFIQETLKFLPSIESLSD